MFIQSVENHLLIIRWISLIHSPHNLWDVGVRWQQVSSLMCARTYMNMDIRHEAELMKPDSWWVMEYCALSSVCAYEYNFQDMQLENILCYEIHLKASLCKNGLMSFVWSPSNNKMLSWKWLKYLQLFNYIVVLEQVRSCTDHERLQRWDQGEWV